MFATVGSPAKRDFLALMGIDNVYDSRSHASPRISWPISPHASSAIHLSMPAVSMWCSTRWPVKPSSRTCACSSRSDASVSWASATSTRTPRWGCARSATT
nr:hypothetical protein [Cobetia crustatorum]